MSEYTSNNCCAGPKKLGDTIKASDFTSGAVKAFLDKF